MIGAGIHDVEAVVLAQDGGRLSCCILLLVHFLFASDLWKTDKVGRLRCNPYLDSLSRRGFGRSAAIAEFMKQLVLAVWTCLPVA